MNFKAELTAMKGRLFSPELYQAMGEASTQRRRERGLTWKDAIWRRAQAQLDPQLTPDQNDRLDQLRRQCQETGEYAAVVAFQNGLYTGFQQYFQRDTSDTPYQDFLHGTLLQYTSPKRKTLFRARLEDDQAQADARDDAAPEGAEQQVTVAQDREHRHQSVREQAACNDAGDGADDVAAVARPYDQQQQEDVHHDGLHTDGQVEASGGGKGVEHRGQAGHAARSQAVGHFEAVDAHGKDRRAQDD